MLTGPAAPGAGPRALVVAAPRSGSGKTTVVLALLAAFRRAGVAVRAAKLGPDYIDPAFHAAASGAPSFNLDGWAMGPSGLDAVLRRAAADAELLVVEAAMGLFDGVDAPPGRRGSAAEFAARYRLPVLLVVDAGGQSQSVAALVHGFGSFDPAVRVAGVVLNRVGSARHEALLRAALAARDMPVFGALRRDAGLALPERHLGLVQAREQAGLPILLDRLAALDDDAIARRDVLAAARPLAPAASPPPPASSPASSPAPAPPGQRIAVAEDAAFSFLYPHLAAAWRDAGAELLPFSPLADEPPPPAADCCWLPGGYPELHGGRLAAAERFRAGLAAFARDRPVHGECGGYMVLGDGLVDADGATHRMAGLLRLETSFARRRLHLGYREAELLADGVLGRRGDTLRGHEFHYATVLRQDDEPLAALRDAAGADLGAAGSRRGTVSGSFFHLIASGNRD